MTEAVLETETAERQVGLRLSQAYFGFAMGLALVFGFVCSPHMFAYDISMVRVLVLMAGGMVTLWLMSQRARSARWIGAATALLFAGLAAIDHAAFGALDTLAIYIGQPITTAIMYAEYAGAVAVAAYLLFAPSAKRILCEPPDLAPGAIDGHSWDKPLRERVRTKVFWRDLMIYFVVFSMLGHWAEMLFCRLIVAGVFMGDYDPTNAMLWDQWLFPFTAEGAAVVAIVVLLHPASRWLCQVCLQNSMVYSIAATLIVWGVYPLTDKLLRRSPRGVVNAIAFGLLGMYLFLAMLYFVDVMALFR